MAAPFRVNFNRTNKLVYDYTPYEPFDNEEVKDGNIFNYATIYIETYDLDDNMFYSDLEAMPWTCSNFTYHGSLTKKNIVNLIKKWNLPKNTYIKFVWTYKHKGYEFLVRVY
jgi:hypothetical protein